jgi:small subunit ribosomal protein S13
MARLVGVNLPDDKRIEYALTRIYGVSWFRAGMVLKEASINPDTRVKELSEEDVKKLQTIIEKNFKVEGDLKEEINNNIKRLREIGAYRGIRHLRGLPARGQRTKSNARTRRGKRRTVGALKKEDMLRLQAAATKK